METKTCIICKEVKPLTEFYLRKTPGGRTKTYRGECKQCQVKRSQQWRRNNPEKQKISQRKCRIKSQFGISLEEYDSLLSKQNGKCAICGGHTDGDALAVDHNHKTNEVRGLLCHRCNTAIGLFKDDVSLLQKAIEYLTTASSAESDAYGDGRLQPLGSAHRGNRSQTSDLSSVDSSRF